MSCAPHGMRMPNPETHGAKEDHPVYQAIVTEKLCNKDVCWLYWFYINVFSNVLTTCSTLHRGTPESSGDGSSFHEETR